MVVFKNFDFEEVFEKSSCRVFSYHNSWTSRMDTLQSYLSFLRHLPFDGAFRDYL